jgi:pimeloyl-ACP methyl ester carboxylesterase
MNVSKLEIYHPCSQDLGTLDSQREPLSKRELAAIRQPCLLIHGDKNQIHPIQHAYNMVADLVNAKGGAKLYTIKGIFGFIIACMARIDAIVI